MSRWKTPRKFHRLLRRAAPPFRGVQCPMCLSDAVRITGRPGCCDSELECSECGYICDADPYELPINEHNHIESLA